MGEMLGLLRGVLRGPLRIRLMEKHEGGMKRMVEFKCPKCGEVWLIVLKTNGEDVSATTQVRRKRHRLTEVEKAQIKELLAKGFNGTAIARKLNVPDTTIWNFRNRLRKGLV